MDFKATGSSLEVAGQVSDHTTTSLALMEPHNKVDNMADRLDRPIQVELDKQSRIKAQIIWGEPTKVLVDTGSAISLIPQLLLEYWLESSNKVQVDGGGHFTASEYRDIQIPNGQRLNILGQITIGIVIEGIIVELGVHIVTNLVDVPLVLGRDFLQDHGVQIDYVRSQMCMLPDVDIHASRDYYLKSGEHLAIQGWTSVEIPGGTQGMVHGLGRLNRAHESINFFVGNSVGKFIDGRIIFHLLNPNPFCINIYKGEKLGMFKPLVGLIFPLLGCIPL